MFTGLVETVGWITGRKMGGKSGRLMIRPEKRISDPVPGESIAVNGTCLTLEQASDDGVLTFFVMEETFRRTNLGSLPESVPVNMERALALGDRLGGHLVTGHVDGPGRILSLSKVGDDTELKVGIGAETAQYMVPKGSIAIDGISLTVIEAEPDYFTVRIIPTTWRETNLRFRKTGSILNLEADLIGKYVTAQVRRMNGPYGNSSHQITMDDLTNAGF